MSYSESVKDGVHTVELVCDTVRKGHVHTSAKVSTLSHDSSVKLLFMLGWRLHRGKQLCPECSARVAKRIAGKLQRGKG